MTEVVVIDGKTGVIRRYNRLAHWRGLWSHRMVLAEDQRPPYWQLR